MNPFFIALTAQILLGGLDNLWHHELTERLPARRTARRELALHAAREGLYAVFFMAIAWWQWHGAWAWLLGAVLIVEIGVTLADFLEEDRTRRLPPLERVLHTVLAVNVGVVLALLAPILAEWAGHPAAVQAVDHGAWSWWFTAASVGVGLWGVRDLVAVLALSRAPLWQRRPIRPRYKARPRTVLVTGATGFVGTRLCRDLVAAGDSIIVLTRTPMKAVERFGPQARIVRDLSEIHDRESVDAVVNLAGAAIAGAPWTRARRLDLLRSRTETTRAVVALVHRLHRAPDVLVSASAVGRYGITDDEPLTESAAGQPIFQSRLCRRWECEALRARSAGTRVCVLRTGLVLGRDGGALPQMMRPLRLGLGVVLGSGRQWVSWIHEADMTRIINFALESPRLAGPINATAPAPVRHRPFMATAACLLHRPLLVRVPAWALRRALGEMSQLLVDGQRVIPTALMAAGFRFEHPDIESALSDLLAAPAAQGAGPAECEVSPGAVAGIRATGLQPTPRRGEGS